MRYGITGGIGSGKSSVTEILRARGYTVIDADEISRELTLPGSTMLPLLSSLFGSEILFEDGSLNRKKLADIAFSSKEKTALLNDYMRTAVVVRTLYKMFEFETGNMGQTVFVDAALLYESGMQCYFDKVCLVTAPLEERIKRVMQRDGLSREKVLQRINLQMSDHEKAKLADVIINNSGTLEALEAEVDKLTADIR